MALWLGGRGFGVEREEQQSEIERIKKYIFLEKKKNCMVNFHICMDNY